VISVFFYLKLKLKFGLPVLADTYKEKIKILSIPGVYSCSFCGYTEELKTQSTYTCPTCKHDEWIKSINSKRIK